MCAHRLYKRVPNCPICHLADKRAIGSRLVKNSDGPGKQLKRINPVKVREVSAKRVKSSDTHSLVLAYVPWEKTEAERGVGHAA
jgi:hypothetical protein